MIPSVQNDRSILRLAARGALWGVLLLMVFAGGFVTRGFVDTRTVLGQAKASQVQFDLLVEIHNLLEEYYVRELPEHTEMLYGAARGMLASLEDHYTFFNPPVVTRNEADALAGQHGGIGVDVQYAADGRYLLYPYPDGPAALAGILAGDVLLAVNEEPVVLATPLDVVRQSLKGNVGNGNGVMVRVQSFDSEEIRDYEIEFAVVNTPSVMFRVLNEDSRIGYIHITLFTSRTPDEIASAIAALEDAGIQALVLDLRDNPGGLLQETLVVADEFLTEGVVFYEVTRQEERSRMAVLNGTEMNVPIVVLVNQRTASAAELLASALQQNDRATVIGQQTTGKGSVQLIFPLSDGSSVHVTASEWLTPDRTPLNDTGLEPDIPMIPAEDGRDVELDEAIRRIQQLIQ